MTCKSVLIKKILKNEIKFLVECPFKGFRYHFVLVSKHCIKAGFSDGHFPVSATDPPFECCLDYTKVTKYFYVVGLLAVERP